MFSTFKYPGSSSSSNTNSNAAGTGNSIFSSIGLVGTSTSAASANGDRSASQSNGGADDLPPGWRVVSSRQTGRDYYLHVESGARQWDKPTEADPKRAGDSSAKQTNVTSVFSSGVARMGVGFSSMLNQANSRFQNTLQTKVGISSTSHTARGNSTRGHSDIDREGQILVEMFENERLDGKLLPSDPKRFSDRNATPGSGHDELPDNELPEGHEWATEWEIDQGYTAVDREGWTYATDFPEAVKLLNDELSHASRHPTDMVRRRRWIRYSQDQDMERPPSSPSMSVDSGRSTSGKTAMSSSWGNESALEKSGSVPDGSLFGDLNDDDDPFHRTAQKAQTGFRVNMKFAHRGGKDNTKDYQSINLTDVTWLVKESDAAVAPTDEMMREKTANLEERIKEATSTSVKLERELRSEHEAKAKEISSQQKKLEGLIAQYKRVQRENETLQISVAAHRKTVETLRKEATEKDIMLNEEQRALNAEMAAANQTLEEKAKALATARMRYKRDNQALAASVEEAKKRLEQQKAKAESDSQDPLSKELKAEMEKVRKLHAKLEAVRQHRLALEEESKALYNQVVEKKADLKFKSKKKLENALKDVDTKIQALKEEQGALIKQLAQKPDGEELRKLNTRRNDIGRELGALKERRTMLLAEKRKQDGTD